MALPLTKPPFLSLLLLLLSVLPSLQNVLTSRHPNGILIPVTKDSKTSQYTLQIKQRTPLVPVRLTLDLGGPHLWLNCHNYVSSTYTPARCGSRFCSIARASSCNDCAIHSPPRPGCNNNTCTRQATGPASVFVGEVALDVVSLLSTDGKTVGPSYLFRNVIFTCAFSNFVRGLAEGVTGIAGLGATPTSIPSQISLRLGVPKIFSVCLGEKGAVFFGANSIFMLPDKNISSYLMYTPLIRHTSTHHDLSPNYYISVEGMRFNGKEVPVNKSLLSIDKFGRGGTKISTMAPYTTLQSSIYRALVDTVGKTLSGVPKVTPLKPFGLCFNSSHIGSTRVGPAVPQLELLLQNGAVWNIFGANLMVDVGGDALCLAFVDGGRRPKASIVIGQHQMEDNLLEFDLGKSRLGFSSSLLFEQTTCSNFNFTSTA